MANLKKYLEIFKDMFKKEGEQSGKRKKIVENAVIVAVIGIIIIIAGSSLWGNSGKNKSKDSAVEKDDTEVQVSSQDIDDKQELEKKLKVILEKINGAGKVDVAVTYQYSKELVPAYDNKQTNNETTEKDSGGGTRDNKESNSETNVAYEESQGGGKKPIILKEKQPEVKGVVVVADGAADISVKENICVAVQALVDVPIHKIQVFASN